MLQQEVYNHERKMCRSLYQEKGGRAWGQCNTCGVPLLLEKMRTGKVIDDPVEVQQIRAAFFNN